MSNENTKHTPGPWYWDGATKVWSYNAGDGSDTTVLDYTDGAPVWMDYEEAKANARRIVACVNACEGIPIEALVPGWVKAGYEGTYREKQELQQQRNELKQKYEMLKRGCLAETEAKETYLVERNAMQQQRDELLAVLERITNEFEHIADDYHAFDAWRNARAAIAKVQK